MKKAEVEEGEEGTELALATYYVDENHMEGCEYMTQWHCDKNHTFLTFK